MDKNHREHLLSSQGISPLATPGTARMNSVPANASATDPQVAAAVRQLQLGGLIAYPTEGVWGLGCDPGNQEALQRLIALKGRSADKGLILIAGHIDQVEPYLAGIDPEQRRQLEATWPGPVTWLVPDRGRAPRAVVGQHPTVAIRVSDHPLVQALCAAFGRPIVSTSANPSGQPAAMSAEQVRAWFGGQLGAVVEGALGGRDRPSQIRDLATLRVLRD